MHPGRAQALGIRRRVGQSRAEGRKRIARPKDTSIPAIAKPMFRWVGRTRPRLCVRVLPRPAQPLCRWDTWQLQTGILASEAKPLSRLTEPACRRASPAQGAVTRRHQPARAGRELRWHQNGPLGSKWPAPHARRGRQGEGSPGPAHGVEQGHHRWGGRGPGHMERVTCKGDQSLGLESLPGERSAGPSISSSQCPPCSEADSVQSPECSVTNTLEPHLEVPPTTGKRVGSSQTSHHSNHP